MYIEKKKRKKKEELCPYSQIDKKEKKQNRKFQFALVKEFVHFC